MPQVGFEPTIPVFERAKTVHNLDRTAIVIGIRIIYFLNNKEIEWTCQRISTSCLVMSFINRNHDHGHGGAAGYSMTKSINAFHQSAMVREITGPIALPHALLTAYREPEIDMFLKGIESLSPAQG
jgi:hypothetical protein